MSKASLSKSAGSPVLHALKTLFADLYGGSPAIYRAPGRVNLIGEHTDYNDGFVMPAALNLYTYVAVGPRTDRRLHVYSANFKEKCEIDLDSIHPGRTNHWSDYVRGVAGVLQSAGHQLHGANLAIRSDVPLGSGLSSSAALEVSTAWALLSNSRLSASPTQIAQVCQKSEHVYVETRCGIMDQFISCQGRASHALMLDCRSLEFELLPIPPGVRLMVCNTMVKHEHASGEYNTRRRECEEGVRALAEVLPEIRALRDVTLDELERHRELLNAVIYKRVRHVVSENERVKKAARLLQAGNVNTFGELMADSHRSLRDDYEVSIAEVDLMVELASRQTGVYGARMTGGGFGGSTINLVDADHTEGVRQKLERDYQEKTGIKPVILICEASDGAGAVAES
jgi:galactokinase